jgi:hypothetical protein
MKPDELREALLALAAECVDRCHGQIQDVGDYRRIVQCVCDLTRSAADEAAQVVRVIMTPPTDEYAG